MKTNKTLIVCIVISTIVLLSLILISETNVGETALASSNTSSSLSDAVISAVLSGSTSTSSVTLGPSPNPINTTVSIDIRINNAVGFWGWTLSTVTWNPAVLQLTKVTEGPFLSDNTGGDPTAIIGNSADLWNNTSGVIMGGLSEGIEAADTSTDASGVLATLTFNVTGSGSSPVTIAGGNLKATSTDTTGVNVSCDSATVLVSNTSSPSQSPSSSATPTPALTPTPTLNSNTTSPSQSVSTQPTSTAYLDQAPEFPLWAILPIFVIPSLAAITFLWKKKRLNKSYSLH